MKFTLQGSPLRGLIYAISLVPVMLMTSSLQAEVLDQDADIQKVRESVGKILKNDNVSSIKPSGIEGLYEVMVGPQLFYVTANGKYLISGKLYDIDNKEDLTTPKIEQAKAGYIESVGDENMVIFAPKEYKHTITVFTDIDCGYCRKLHSEIEDYNDLGIRVRYLMFPRAGIGSDSYKKAVSVLCADDRNEATTLSKAGKDIPSKSCDDPVREQYELGKLLGVSGTPAIFLENGAMLPGYVPAKKMSKILNELDMEVASQGKTTSQ